MRVLNIFYKGVHAISKMLNLPKANLFNVDILMKCLPNHPHEVWAQGAHVKSVWRLCIAKMD